MNLEIIRKQSAAAAEEIIEAAKLDEKSILIIGCSSSEIIGEKIGSSSSPDTAKAVLDGILSVCKPKGIYVAAQCCEHLNRAVIVEKTAVPYLEHVNVRPVPKAGGSFAAAAYEAFDKPVAVEEIKADAGLDIGYTLIGMHLKKVAVPVRLVNNRIGNAVVLAARVRPKFIGGERAHYDADML